MTAATVRAMSLNDVRTLVDWAAFEGWNPGLADAAIFHATDPGGFIGAFVDGELAAGIAAVSYGQNYGFVGLYISRPDLRGKGYGKQVWDAGMRRLAGRTIGLDGVDAQIENYHRKGFELSDRTIRYKGYVRGVTPTGSSFERISPSLWPRLTAFDNLVFGSPRAAFLASWIDHPHIAFAAMDGKLVTGFAVARPCREGWKVGPLFAERTEIAIGLMDRIAIDIGDEIAVDVPEPQAKFATFLKERGLASVFETTRMYLGSPKALHPSVFGVTTLELG